MNQAVDAARQGQLSYLAGLDADTLKALCRKKDEDHRSLLHTACGSGQLEVVQLLAQAMQDRCAGAINDADEDGWTPLQTAVSSGHEAVTDWLLANGADVNAQNSGGRAALHYAASKGRLSLMRALLKHGATPDVKDSTGSTPMHRAASAGKPEAIVLLLDAKARIDPKDAQGATPLYVAIASDQAQVAFLLAARGADLNAATKEGDTPLQAAGENGPGLQRAQQHGLPE